MLSGVPQGSHMAPLLFTLFIDDLPLVIKYSRVLMNPEDVKICLKHKNISCHLDLQSDLHSFQIWCRDNELNLTGSKCKVMAFRQHHTFLKGRSLVRITRVDDLGVLLEPTQKFLEHISALVNMARAVLGFIKR